MNHNIIFLPVSKQRCMHMFRPDGDVGHNCLVCGAYYMYRLPGEWPSHLIQELKKRRDRYDEWNLSNEVLLTMLQTSYYDDHRDKIFVALTRFTPLGKLLYGLE